MKRIKKKQPDYTTPGLIFTLLLFVPTVKFFVGLAKNNVVSGGNPFLLVIYLLIAYIVILFQFHHTDEYTKQRGADVNFIGLILFTFFAVYVIQA